MSHNTIYIISSKWFFKILYDMKTLPKVTKCFWKGKQFEIFTAGKFVPSSTDWEFPHFHIMQDGT